MRRTSDTKRPVRAGAPARASAIVGLRPGVSVPRPLPPLPRWRAPPRRVPVGFDRGFPFGARHGPFFGRFFGPFLGVPSTHPSVPASSVISLTWLVRDLLPRASLWPVRYALARTSAWPERYLVLQFSDPSAIFAAPLFFQRLISRSDYPDHHQPLFVIFFSFDESF